MKIFLVIISLLIANSAIGLEANNYYGNYDVTTKKPWQVAPSLSGPLIEEWLVPTANTAYTIAVLVPHLKDSYWKAIAYSLQQEAINLGVNLKFFTAGGYDKGNIQRHHLTEDILKEEVNGVLLGSIFYDKLDRFIAQIDYMGIPVVAMINDVLSPHVKAAIMTTYYKIGYKLGEFVINDAKGKNIKIAFFPGTKKAIWATDTYEGFIAALKENKLKKPLGKVTIVAIKYAPLTKHFQQEILDKVLTKKTNIDYIIANGLCSTIAGNLISDKFKKTHEKTKIISTYLLEDVYDALKKKQIYGTIVDFNQDKARMALHLLIRALNGETANNKETNFPLRSETFPQVITVDDLKDQKYQADKLFAPKDWKLENNS